jgi:chemotaxis protein CheD
MKNSTEGNTGVKRLKDIDPDLEKRTIIAGELCVSREPVIIKTLLGSCVSVCLYDPQARVGGMNHILLPGSADMDQFNKSARYGVNAMDKLMTRMLVNGADRKRLVAKIFGGAHILNEVDSKFSPGVRNVEFAFQYLETESIPVAGFNVAGFNPRRIYFNTGTGKVLMERVRRAEEKTITESDRKLLERAARDADKAGQVTWFK